MKTSSDRDYRPGAGTALWCLLLLLGCTSAADVVHVAPPTGDTETDRANIQAAFDAVQPGGTVQFAPGTYLLGAGAMLRVPDVTVLGDPNGTVLRGCDPETFAVDTTIEGAQLPLVYGCTGLYVQTERQTIRGLTFEYASHGIVVGRAPTTEAEHTAMLASGAAWPAAYESGGQLIEGNTFRASQNGLRVLGIGNELSVVRDNDFIDVFHAIGTYGAPLHFVDNRVMVSEPERVPLARLPGSAILVGAQEEGTDCSGHVVAGNRIEGYPGAIYVLAFPGRTCRNVEIRDNTIRVARVSLQLGGYYARTEQDSTLVDVPITLMGNFLSLPWIDADTDGVVENIHIEGNHIIGAEGLGILVHGSRNRISGNTITEIQRRAPFPGITWIGSDYTTWEVANGSAIWLSPGSDENEIIGNTFGDIAGSAVYIEGDRNQVELRGASDAVRDMGSGNQVRGPGGTVLRDPR
jgi:parallel beta-helix repeat protein